MYISWNKKKCSSRSCTKLLKYKYIQTSITLVSNLISLFINYKYNYNI